MKIGWGWGLLLAATCISNAVQAEPVAGARGLYTTPAEAIANPWGDICEPKGAECTVAVIAEDGGDDAISWRCMKVAKEDTYCSEPTLSYSVDCSEPDAILMVRMWFNVCRSSGGQEVCQKSPTPIPPQRPRT